MRLLYQFFIFLFSVSSKIAALFNGKARQFVRGRVDWRKQLMSGAKNLNDAVWIHCSSLGEFEQGRSVIEALKSNGEQVVLTFFSPSGYEQMKDYPLADLVMYLPIDTRSNARDFIQMLKPKAVFFVKYEFWFNFIDYAHRAEVPIYLVSGIFRHDHYFFKSYGKWFRNQLKKFTHFFVQNSRSVELLNSIGLNNITLGGDTRFDRVLEIKNGIEDIPEIATFVEGKKVIVAGSTWPEDEAILKDFVEEFDGKIIIAPHEVEENRLIHIEQLFENSARFSTDSDASSAAQVLIIDRIGVLSRIYQYADAAYIGGGFGKGIHNTLEAAVFGKAILFGPNYRKFDEANWMADQASALSIQNSKELNDALTEILSNDEKRKKMGEQNQAYVESMSGATTKIMQHLRERDHLIQ